MLPEGLLALLMAIPQSAPPSVDPGDGRHYRQLAQQPAAMPDRLFVLQENAIGLREQAIAQLVAERALDPRVKEIAGRFADAHGAGVAMLQRIAGGMGIEIPDAITTLETAQLDALRALQPRDLETWWLLHQRAMHAWDIATFTDYAGRSTNADLDRYVRSVIKPLRTHSTEIDRLVETGELVSPRR